MMVMMVIIHGYARSLQNVAMVQQYSLDFILTLLYNQKKINQYRH